MDKYYLGVDVGGTKIKAVLLLSKNKHKPKFFETETPKNIVDFAKALESFIEKVIDGKKILGIGMGLPGIVDNKKGILVECNNLPFLSGWKAAKFLERFSKKVAVENDSRAFLLAEMKWGEVKKYKNAVGLTIGTGIGGGIFIDGKLYRGPNNSAGEFGKIIVRDRETFEFLGNKGTALSVEERNKFVGIAVANIVNFLNPEAVVIGGGGITSGAVSIEKVREIALANIPYVSSKKVKIVSTKLGYYSPAVGAGLLVC